MTESDDAWRNRLIALIEKDSDSHDAKLYLPWFTAAIAVLVFLWRFGPGAEEWGRFTGAARAASVGFGAALYFPLLLGLQVFFNAARPVGIYSDSAQAKEIGQRIGRRGAKLYADRIGDSLPKLALVAIGVGFLAIGVEGDRAALWNLIPLSIVTLSYYLYLPGKKWRWLRRGTWVRRKAMGAPGKLILFLSGCIVFVGAWGYVPEHGAAVAYTVAAMVALGGCLAVTVAWLFLDNSRPLLAQLRFAIAVETMDVETARRAYTAIEVLRRKRVTAVTDLSELLAIVSEKGTPATNENLVDDD